VLPPLLLSAALLLVGALMVGDAVGEKEAVIKLLAATLIAGSFLFGFSSGP
jgi:hypothetical protein